MLEYRLQSGFILLSPTKVGTLTPAIADSDSNRRAAGTRDRTT